MDGGLRVVDVWESQEALDTFVRDQLMPALQRLDIALPPNFRPAMVWPVSAMLK